MIRVLNKKLCLGLFLDKKINKKYTKNIKKTGGRNNQGKITVNHIGGGSKSIYKIIDFKRKKKYLQIKNIVYDPARNVFVADCFICYILCPSLNNIYKILLSSFNLKKPLLGDYTVLKNIPINNYLNSIEYSYKLGGKISRSFESYSIFVDKYLKKSKIKLSSGNIMFLDNMYRASVGKLLGLKKKLKKKAGESRWLGYRPMVRGVAMNPVDHPHGGGEGKTSGGRPSVNSLGKLTKGFKTRRR